ncbi:MAG TPA: hypothetical protein VIO94_08710 [Phenylobacterium sp.]
MRHHSVGAAIAAALIAAPAIAADWGDSGGWDVVQAPNYCTLMKAYDSPGATELMLTLRVDGTVGLSLTNTNWSARRDGRYEMSFAIDEAEFGGGAVVGFQASRGRRGVVTTMPPAFLPKFAAGDRMLIYKDGETVEELSLEGSAGGLSRAKRCLADLRNGEIAPPPPVRARPSRPAPDPFAEDDTAEDEPIGRRSRDAENE